MIQLGDDWGIAENNYELFYNKRMEAFSNALKTRIIFRGIDKQ